MAIPVRIVRSFLPALVGVGLVLAACSSDSDESPGAGGTSMGPDPGSSGSDSSGGGTGGAAEPGEAGSPPVSGTAGMATGGTPSGGTAGSAMGGDPEPGAGGTPPEPGSAGAGGTEDPGPEEPTEGFLRGKALVEAQSCATCHQADFGGLAVFPNISPDEETGIGSWSDAEIATAIRTGVDKEGQTMCAQMLRYSFTDGEVADVIEFLRGIPAVSRKITADCP